MNRKNSTVGIIATFILSTLSSQAEVLQEPSGWFRSGNCWFSEQGFLYCSEHHPYDENSTGSFISFACFRHYQAVLLSHPESPVESKIRKIKSEFGNREYSDVWIAADAKESFMSNNISAANEGYINLLKGLANPNSKNFRFLIEPGSVEGMIELTGEEFQVVGLFTDACAKIAN